MYSGNNLHQAAITTLEPFTVQGFHFSSVRRTVLCQHYPLFTANVARHGERPKFFIAQLGLREMVNIRHLRQQSIDFMRDRGDELQQGLRKICGDPTVS
ncbi:Uncharacterised protein [Vibrio cholerae]|nr:Uncharacterised protein [Vibrio cholerae]CSB65554.1 Uncharacterised protein [Vibrio cholerae]CSB75947.1 Uncharacterised protein [Vibrio cholerae]CSC03053.1 Uncharacterised protein [Vibrio cholerae]CSC10568.1 Uncharacterised protein [Vibrio cholerae]